MANYSSKRLGGAILLVVALNIGLVGSSSAAKPPPQTTPEGLELTPSKNVPVLYTRPGASFEQYTKVMLDPVQVAFSKSWDPRDYGGKFGLSKTDVEKIRQDVGALAHETFSKVLNAGGYPIVTEPTEGVLQVACYVVDLYINAPDKQTAGVTRRYVKSAGSMVMVIELRDAVTGTLLARAYDRAEQNDIGGFSWANSVSNRAVADSMFTRWANRLKEALDATKGAKQTGAK